MARVLVFGSRSWDDWNETFRILKNELHPGDTIIHGAAKGADTQAATVASIMGYKTEAFPADWKFHGRAAGPIRNQQMLDAGIDRAIGLQTDGPGSKDMLKRLRKAGTQVKIYP